MTFRRLIALLVINDIILCQNDESFLYNDDLNVNMNYIIGRLY